MGRKNLFIKQVCVFARHYGFKVSSSKLRREVVKVAELSEKFVEDKLAKSIEEAEINPKKNTERLLLEARWVSSLIVNRELKPNLNLAV